MKKMDKRPIDFFNEGYREEASQHLDKKLMPYFQKMASMAQPLSDALISKNLSNLKSMLDEMLYTISPSSLEDNSFNKAMKFGEYLIRFIHSLEGDAELLKLVWPVTNEYVNMGKAVEDSQIMKIGLEVMQSLSNAS